MNKCPRVVNLIEDLNALVTSKISVNGEILQKLRRPARSISLTRFSFLAIKYLRNSKPLGSYPFTCSHHNPLATAPPSVLSGHV